MTKIGMAAVLAMTSLLCAEPASAAKCLKQTDAVSGDLRKVISRRLSNEQLVTNWHIQTSSPLCIKIGDSTVSDAIDIQVVFKRPEDEKKAEEYLGMAVAVKGVISDPRDDGDTGWVVVLDAVFADEMNDAGEVRR